MYRIRQMQKSWSICSCKSRRQHCKTLPTRPTLAQTTISWPALKLWLIKSAWRITPTELNGCIASLSSAIPACCLTDFPAIEFVSGIPPGNVHSRYIFFVLPHSHGQLPLAHCKVGCPLMYRALHCIQIALHCLSAFAAVTAAAI